MEILSGYSPCPVAWIMAFLWIILEVELHEQRRRRRFGHSGATHKAPRNITVELHDSSHFNLDHILKLICFGGRERISPL